MNMVRVVVTRDDENCWYAEPPGRSGHSLWGVYDKIRKLYGAGVELDINTGDAELDELIKQVRDTNLRIAALDALLADLRERALRHPVVQPQSQRDAALLLGCCHQRVFQLRR